MLETFFFIAGAVLFLFALVVYEVHHQKLRKELKERIKGMQHEENRLHQKVLHAEYHFREIEAIERSMKQELEATKRNRQFVNSAIRGKLQKTKKQSKRRKRAS